MAVFFDDAPDGWLDLLLLWADVAVKSGLVLALAGLVAWLWRRGSAAARHLIWGAALASLVLLPVLMVALPGWHLPVPVAGLKTPPTMPVHTPDVPPVVADLAQVPGPTSDRPPVAWPPGQTAPTPASATTSHRPASQPAPGSVDPPVTAPATSGAAPSETSTVAPLFAVDGPWLAHFGRILVVVWFAGVLLLGCRLALGLISLAHLRRTSERVTGGPLHELAAELAVRMGVRRR
jgi:hypothetical protein